MKGKKSSARLNIPKDRFTINDSSENISRQDPFFWYCHDVLREYCEVGALSNLERTENCLRERCIGGVNGHAYTGGFEEAFYASNKYVAYL